MSFDTSEFFNSLISEIPSQIDLFEQESKDTIWGKFLKELEETPPDKTEEENP